MLESETLKVDGIQDTGDLDLVDHMSRMSIGLPNVQKKTLVNNNPIFNDSWISSKVLKIIFKLFLYSVSKENLRLLGIPTK